VDLVWIDFLLATLDPLLVRENKEQTCLNLFGFHCFVTFQEGLISLLIEELGFCTRLITQMEKNEKRKKEGTKWSNI